METTAQATGSAGRRTPLNRERVLAAAVALADKGGVESLTMRKLAKQLGLESPMSLYNHVANRDDLLDGIVDIVFREIELPSLELDWKTAMRQRAISTREALQRHPWAIGHLESRTKPGPANLRQHNAMIGCLRQAGFSIEMAIHASSVLDAYTYGFALQEKTLPFETVEESAELAEMMVRQFQFLAKEYPYLAETGAHITKTGYDFAAEFEFGLEVVLDSVDKFRAAG